MVRLIHTSDWHLGQNFYGYDRIDEHEKMLGDIVNLCAEQAPDLLLISGDIFDGPQPSASVQSLFNRSLISILKACPGISIVATSGNHDSGAKLEAFRVPWAELGVVMVGGIRKETDENGCLTDDSLDAQIVEIPGKAFVIAVPYVYERNLPENYYRLLSDRVAARNTDALPVIMMAHTYVHGSDYRGNEADESGTGAVVGGVEGLSLQEFGNGYDYLALGHIHKAQKIAGSYGRAFYSGSPIAVSFAEDYEHAVSVVEISGHGEVVPSVERAVLSPLRPLVNLPSSGRFAPWDDVKMLLKTFLAEKPKCMTAYVRLNLEVDSYLPSAVENEAARLCEDGGCRFCPVNVKRIEIGKNLGERKVLSVSELKDRTPLELLRQYMSDTGEILDEEMENLFRAAVADVAESLNKESN